jgi:hypothetical protein
VSNISNETGFVRLVKGDWEPEELDEEELAQYTELPEEFESLKGCTLEDVGWMKVRYEDV